MLFAAIPKPDSENPFAAACYAPLLYFAMQLAQSLKNAYFYASDMKMMAKDPNHIELKTLFFVYFMSFAVNTLGTMVSTNACFDLFKFPTCLARAARNIPGARDVQLELDVERFSAVRCK